VIVGPAGGQSWAAAAAAEVDTAVAEVVVASATVSFLAVGASSDEALDRISLS
jgi:hypothetical protein